MSQEQYDLVFSGQLVPGFELEPVKKNIQALFRIDEAKVQVLFSGKSITLKKNLDLDVATKFRVAMKKAGARVDLILCKEEVVNAKPVVASEAPSAPPVNQGAQASAVGGGEFDTSLGAQPSVTDTPRPKIEAPDFGIAAMGGDLLKPEEKRVVDAVEVDTSQLSVAPQEGNLVDESELYHPDIVEVTIPNIDIAPVGSDVLREDERKKTVPVEVDISALSLAETGGKLSPDAPAPPPAPDVSHITLED